MPVDPMMDPRYSHGLAVLGAAVLAMTSWRWGYEPAVRAVERDRQQIVALSSRLAQVDAMVQAAGGRDAWQADHLTRLTALKKRFPPQAHLPQLLNALTETIKTGEVRLLTVSQGNVEAVQDEGQPVLVDGQPCYRLPVTVSAQGRYHALVQTMDRLMASAFPSLVSFEQVELRLLAPLGAELDATLHLFLYVLGTPAEPAPDA